MSRAMARSEIPPGPCPASWRRASALISSVAAARRRARKVGAGAVVRDVAMPPSCQESAISANFENTALDTNSTHSYIKRAVFA